MALTVEDGTGLSGADALASLDYVAAYHEARGNSAWFTKAASEQEAAIRRASTYLSNSVAWKGYKLNGRSQALSWPRTGVYDAEADQVPSDEVPDEVKQAAAEIALREVVTPGTMSPDVTPADQKVLVQVDNIRWERTGARGADAERPVLTLVMDLLKGLTAARSRLSGPSVRG